LVWGFLSPWPRKRKQSYKLLLAKIRSLSTDHAAFPILFSLKSSEMLMLTTGQLNLKVEMIRNVKKI
jgi:hypothetical protein